MIELMRALHNVQPDGWQVLAGINANMLLASEQPNLWYRAHVVGARRRRSGRSPVTTGRNELALRHRAGQVSLVHRTYHPVVDLLPSSTSVIETVHDLWDFIASDEQGARARFRRRMKLRALRRADRIVCVSQSTRNYLGELHPYLADRAVVIPHGTRRLSDMPARIVADRPFFLFVGKRDRYKNFAIVLKAMARMTGDTDLICFGGGAFTERERECIAALGLAVRVRQTGGDDHRLAGCYEAAVALLYPSRHEGFGLPLLEAMTHGCPVIAAPLTSLPEVGGDAALYADADDAEEWADVMSRLMQDADARHRAIAAGRVRAAGFSWDVAARRHAALYDQLVAPVGVVG